MEDKLEFTSVGLVTLFIQGHDVPLNHQEGYESVIEDIKSDYLKYLNGDTDLFSEYKPNDRQEFIVEWSKVQGLRIFK